MSGIHHVTAISGRASRNLEFYTHVLGLRFVKKTVNFDDPGTYHLYYGDEQGHPGTILTFFPWEHAAAGRNGDGLTEETAFRVPAASMGYWTHRFIEHGVAHEALEKRFGDPVLAFTDPDGMKLALIGAADVGEPAWSAGIPAEHAIRGFHGVTLMLAEGARTGAILTDVLGFEETAREGSFTRYRSLDDVPGNTVTIRETGGFLPGRLGRGSVHHIAFRASGDAEQAAMARKLVEAHGMHPTQQLDRQYFRSVYFREPGGILFEIATDQPGFAVDEAVATLGRDLKLPPFLEARRAEIEAALPPLAGVEKGGVMSGLSFIHRFELGTQPASRPLLVLHGTGGNESDLVPLGKMIAPGAPLLSPRGKVLEHGMPRFFRRLAEGMFDEDDVRARAHELADFVEAARKDYGLAPPVALGYSNGANIAAAVLLLRPQVLAGGMLLRAMVPLQSPGPAGGLEGKAVLIASGARDPIATPANAARLKAMLEQVGAQVDHRVLPAGHELSRDDVDLARAWLQEQDAALPAAS